MNELRALVLQRACGHQDHHHYHTQTTQRKDRPSKCTENFITGYMYILIHVIKHKLTYNFNIQIQE